APAIAGETTVGRFVEELAKVKNLNATDPAIAADSLRAVGVRLDRGLDLNKRLTESDVAEISRAAGLLVTTSNPDAFFDSGKVDRFFQAFQTELALGASTTACDPATEDCSNPGQGSGPGNGESGPPFDPFSKGRGNPRGKGKGDRTPTDPE
ncbi:MAG TPA: hypothetical protein VD788_05105, partial [Candidatus Polarisedimenticolaceae bacterium]|nr:hypothetical protein [Candidatus Polarisedimenticolaceae bacterium]